MVSQEWNHNDFGGDSSVCWSGVTSDSVKMELLRLMMLLLPQENVTLLRHLLGLLRRTSETNDNLMDQHGLAIIFAPNLFAPQMVKCLYLLENFKTDLCYYAVYVEL